MTIGQRAFSIAGLRIMCCLPKYLEAWMREPADQSWSSKQGSKLHADGAASVGGDGPAPGGKKKKKLARTASHSESSDDN